MDLDFSFALVSSLTPRSQITKTPLLENNKLSSKSLKAKQTQSVLSKSHHSKVSQNKNDKENHLSKEQLMRENECLEADPESEKKCCDKKMQSNTRISSCFPVDMTNIAVRKSKGRGRRKGISNALPLSNDRLSSSKSDNIDEKSCILKNKSVIFDTAIAGVRANGQCSEVINVHKHSDGNSPSASYEQKGIKRKSPRLNRSSESLPFDRSSLDIVKSPDSFHKDSFFKNSIVNEENDERNSPRLSGVSEISLSTAYDSDSFQRTRHRVQVIPETPESDESIRNNTCEKKKSFRESFTPSKSEASVVSEVESEVNEQVAQNRPASRAISPENETFKGFSENFKGFGENFKGFAENFKGFEESFKGFNDNITDIASDEERKKTVRSSKETLTDLFRLESSVQLSSIGKKKEPNVTKGETTRNNPKKDKRKLSLSPVIKEIDKKDMDCKKDDSVKKKKKRRKEVVNKGIKTELKEKNLIEKLVDSSTNKGNLLFGDKYLKKSPITIISPKATLILPTEVIPKFEHINKWLKDTQENSVIEFIDDSSMNGPNKVRKPTRQRSNIRVSLSPRIKIKMTTAQTTLEEEQKLFGEIHGSDVAKRLSDDVVEVVSISSSPESVELSEKVLEKLYGTVWQKNTVLPQSEPRRGRKKGSVKKKSPQTERKKQRTSIYDVFSSSSSEDRFEEFLETVQRGKLESTRRGSGRLGTPDFINDSSSESDCSLAFYQNIVSSGVKEELKRFKDIDTESQNSLSAVNRRRRLSFSSSKDDGSENGKTDVKPSNKGRRKPGSGKKKGSTKPKTKNKIEKDKKDDSSSHLDIFTLVTPIQIKDKKTDNKLEDRIKNIIEPDVPKTIGKSKTPKNSTKRNDNSNTEERLKAKYLGEGTFKVPKTFSSLKTPTKPIKADVPPSPTLSFLSSLSDMTGGLPCHPDALVYKKSFKTKREELTKKLFTLYNREIFENKLPADMLIQWNIRMTSTSGYCYNKRLYSNNQVFRTSRIVLSTKILDRADRVRDTLIHELCHAATWIVNGTSDGHGPSWRAWADKANRRFPELPVIKRCHDYAISTKFTYKCMSCGYSIGRHTKSLDTDRKRCGYCWGKFQVFVTAKMSTASATSGSDSVKTQRTPTGFALFVKENYANVKKENNVPHAQVMKLLSQKFSEVKISKQTANEPAPT